MATKRNVQYKPLATEDQDEYDDVSYEEKDLRFSYTPRKYNRIPWKSIALAVFLLLLGMVLLVLSYFIHTGHMPGDSSQANGLLFLGILAFLPAPIISTVLVVSVVGTSIFVLYTHALRVMV